MTQTFQKTRGCSVKQKQKQKRCPKWAENETALTWRIMICLVSLNPRGVNHWTWETVTQISPVWQSSTGSDQPSVLQLPAPSVTARGSRQLTSEPRPLGTGVSLLLRCGSGKLTTGVRPQERGGHADFHEAELAWKPSHSHTTPSKKVAFCKFPPPYSQWNQF